MSTTPLEASAYFDAIAPELAASSRKTTFLDIADLKLGGEAGRWGTVYNLARAYLAAHLLTSSPEDGALALVTGSESSRSAGDLSVAHGSAPTVTFALVDTALMSTRYGLEFIAIRNTRGASAGRIINPGY